PRRCAPRSAPGLSRGGPPNGGTATLDRTDHAHVRSALHALRPGGPAAGWFVFQLAAVFAIIYFLILRPQKKQQERHRQLLASLQRGDKVLTAGGILGQVVHLKDDEGTVKTGEARVIVARANLSSRLHLLHHDQPQ